MDPKLVILTVLLTSSFCVLAANAAASPEELALRTAILSAGSGNVTLTKDVTLTADLPQLPDGKSLTVTGRCGSGGKLQCTISGAKKYRHFWKLNEAPVTLVLHNLVITSTNAVGETAAVEFGSDRSFLTVSNVKFVDNPRALSLYKINGLVRNSQFVGHKKGAVLQQSDEAGPGETGNWDLKFVGCLFSGNQAQPGQGGGAVFVDEFATVTIENCIFQKNSADYVGGALRFKEAGGKISGSTFVSNTAKKESGGALSVYRSFVTVTTSSFQENVATGVDGGGALRLSGGYEGSQASFDRCSFTKNKAPASFGGWLLITGYSDATFCKCTFSGNTGKNGAASNVYVQGESNTILTNPKITIPYITTAAGAAVIFKKGSC